MAEKLHKVVPEKQTSFKEEMKRKIYPTFQIDDEDLPELKDWEVGGKYTLVMVVEQLSMRQGNEWQGADKKDKKIHATFKILEVGVEEPEPETYGEEYARRMGGKK
jgi:hypothetical protein